MGIMVRGRAQYHESGLMEQRRGGEESGFDSQQLQAEPRLPTGWEKCLDLKSGLIYFKDWNSGTLTYRDPRQSVPLATQRSGLLSISLSSDAVKSSTSNAGDVEGALISARSMKRKRIEPGAVKKLLPWDCPWDHATTTTTTMTTTSVVSVDVLEQSLELSLNLPGTSTPCRPTGTSSQDGSVCTMEKVRSALDWLQNSRRLQTVNTKITGTTDPTTLSLLSPRPLSSRESSCSRLRSRLHLESVSKSESAVTSTQSSSVCFTSPSVMSYQGDDEEVQQPREDSVAKSLEVESAELPVTMVTVGCKSCLMYVMLSKSHPSCPKCGNTDVVLLELPVPLPKKRRRTTSTIETPSTWS